MENDGPHRHLHPPADDEGATHRPARAVSLSYQQAPNRPDAHVFRAGRKVSTEPSEGRSEVPRAGTATERTSLLSDRRALESHGRHPVSSTPDGHGLHRDHAST